MSKVLFILSLFIVTPVALAAQEVKPLYQLPEKNVAETTKAPEATVAADADVFLVGSDSGLYKINNSNKPSALWTEGRVDQIMRVKVPNKHGNLADAWVMRTSKGIFYSEDLSTFTERDNGLPFLTLKKFNGEKIALYKQIQELKDLCVNPANNSEMVTATKDAVYITKDAGLNWRTIGSMSKGTAGMKAAAIATINGETVVFMSHPIFGFSYIYPDRKGAAWVDVSAGFEIIPTMSYPDEISDILPVLTKDEQGNEKTEIYISQSYIPRIYRFNWAAKRGELIYKGDEPVQAIDGLSEIDGKLLFTKLEGFDTLDLSSNKIKGAPSKFSDWEKGFNTIPEMVNTAYIPKSRSGFGKAITVNELWELYPGTINTPYAEKAMGQKSIYASAYQCRLQSGIDKYKKLLKDRNMNSIVIDMKDDYGLLRYDTKDPLVKEKGYVTQYKIDLDHFVSEFKKDGTYLIARIVTFKDKSLSQYANGKYAVWNSATNRPWLGTKGTETIKNDDGTETTKTTYYDEHWVDPYCQEVWEYNVAIAKELIARGFDEIQFDYIRFPTDGKNIGSAQYRWREKGMDQESALISFLMYARENIDAPIGIDIYGANGWYRSGTRTGQDAEMLAEYVDVIGPMFYPSHFEQNFLEYAPVADRTYRIYYYGSFRNTVLCRNRAIVRPWVQSFYLNVRYDRAYYNTEYIRKEFFGTRDALNRGYMCWNNSGDYSMTPPDVADNAKFTGTAPEANFKRPAFGTRMRSFSVPKSIDMAILDTVKDQEKKDKKEELIYTSFLR